MFCPNCGTMNNDGNANCTNCGAVLRPAQPQQPRPQQPSPYAQQSPYAQPRAYQPQPQPARPAPQPQPQPTAGNYYPPQPPATTFNFYNFWYKFMVYAGFFMAAGGFFFLGLGQLIGWQYGATSGYRYVEGIKDQLGGLRAADIVSGILFMFLAVFAVYVWFQFRYLRYRAPLFTYILFGGATALYIVYFLIEIIVLSTSKKVASGKATEVFPIVFPIILMVMLIAVVAAQLYYFKTEKQRFIYYPQPKAAPAPAYPQNNQYNYQQNNQYNYQQNSQPVNYNQNNQNGNYQ